MQPGATGMRMQDFDPYEATIDGIQLAYARRDLRAVDLVELFLRRIEAYDRAGPRINAIITLNPRAREEAASCDAALRASGPIGKLHGVPVIVKDQIDAAGMPTTLGSALLRDHYPQSDAFVVARLRSAGAIILAKTTLGELGGGDTHGSVFGSTRNPYALDRTPGGSSGGTAAGVSADLAVVGLGQEGLASIRRPAAWCCVVGMRPTAGLVSRTGVYAGWPLREGSVGPIGRTVRDVAVTLDVLSGYDAADPLTAHGVGRSSHTYSDLGESDGLVGARIGILRTPMGRDTDPTSADFRAVDRIFERSVRELAEHGATVLDPILIPDLNELLAKRVGRRSDDETAWTVYFTAGGSQPFRSRDDLVRSMPDDDAHRRRLSLRARPAGPSEELAHSKAREELMTRVLKVMADLRLDAIVHKSAEHQPGRIREALDPPYPSGKGATHLNTFLVYVPAISVPSGFTSDGLPTGITFLGRPYDDRKVIQLAHAYEQATKHRRPPTTTPQLSTQT